MGCSNHIPQISAACCGEPDLASIITTPPSGLDLLKLQLYEKQLGHVIDTTSPELLANPETILVCGSPEEAAAMRLLLDRRQLFHIGTRVAAQVPQQPVSPAAADRQWTADISAAKEAAGRALLPRHAAPFTKSSTTPKARKSQRRRAKAGRKAAR